MPLIDSLKNSSQETAKITVWTKFENTMMYIPPEERKPEPEPVRKAFTVKKGSKVDAGSFRVKDLKDGVMTVEFDMDYVGRAYGKDGYAVRSYALGGFALYFGLNAVLKLPFPKDFLAQTTMASFLIRTVRYLIVTFLVIGVYPLVFDKIRFKKAKA